jgi:putative membrane protein insertion efficiency factor
VSAVTRTAFNVSAIGLVVVCLVVWNASTLALGSIHVYQHALAGPAARIGLRCRFTPTCSRYSEIVIARDGVVRGGWRALKRVARCGPWTSPGTRDEP